MKDYQLRQVCRVCVQGRALQKKSQICHLFMSVGYPGLIGCTWGKIADFHHLGWMRSPRQNTPCWVRPPAVAGVGFSSKSWFRRTFHKLEFLETKSHKLTRSCLLDQQQEILSHPFQSFSILSNIPESLPMKCKPPDLYKIWLKNNPINAG